MIAKLWKAFARIVNRDHIPPLPRGMLSSEYADIPSEERRVMARVGARSPQGVKIAMRRYGVSTVNELVALLDHHKAKRNVMTRLQAGIRRVLGGTPYDPHAEELRRLGRNRKKDRDLKEIQQRVKVARKAFKEINK